ncbi:MAG: hypothetical protein CML68_19255 [Rhodobacteraceae bacterium]|nr:hypothetical protein [Paracoccaceae bacterium]
MADVSTWGWYSPSPWPGYSAADQDNLDASGNGLAVDPASYVEFTMRDANSDGVIYDADTDDVQPPDPGEYVFGSSLTLYPQEIALYTNSTIVISGVTYSNVDIEVTLFTDGTWGARLMDYSIPAGTHHSDVESITLGTWNGVEYDGVYTANVDDPFVCFAAGTRIATPGGLRAVDTLSEGDAVLTLDSGAQPILWVDRCTVPGVGRNAPHLLRAGAFGAHGSLRLSAQHRLLLHLPDAGAGAGQVLCAIKHLLDPEGGRLVRRQPFGGPVTYVHLLLPRHSLLWAEGIWAESLWPGPQALKQMPPRALDRLTRHIPGIEDDTTSYGAPARPILLARDAKPLVRRYGLQCLIHAAPRPAATGPPGQRDTLRARLCAGALADHSTRSLRKARLERAVLPPAPSV